MGYDGVSEGQPQITCCLEPGEHTSHTNTSDTKYSPQHILCSTKLVPPIYHCYINCCIIITCTVQCMYLRYATVLPHYCALLKVIIIIHKYHCHWMMMNYYLISIKCKCLHELLKYGISRSVLIENGMTLSTTAFIYIYLRAIWHKKQIHWRVWNRTLKMSAIMYWCTLLN